MRLLHHITVHLQTLPQLQTGDPMAPGLIHLAATPVRPELLRPEGAGLRRAGTHLEARSEAPQAMHRPSTDGFKQGCKRVAQEATTGHHRQARGLVDHQQVAVVVDRFPLIGNRLLQPGWTAPTETFSTMQCSILFKKCSVPIELTSRDPLLPHHSIGMAVAIRQPIGDQQAGVSPRHLVAVSAAVVERGRLQVTRRCSKA